MDSYTFRSWYLCYSFNYMYSFWRFSYIDYDEEEFHIPVPNWKILLIVTCWFPFVNTIVLIWIADSVFNSTYKTYDIVYQIGLINYFLKSGNTK